MVNLQRRHFAFIADILLRLKGEYGLTDEQHANIVSAFTHHLRSTNPNFKRDRFYHRSRGILPVRATRKRRSLAAHVWAKELQIDDEANSYWE